MAALTTAQLKARMGVMRGPVVNTVHDFRTMTLGDFDTAYPLSSSGSDRYIPQEDGSYVLRESDQAPLTDEGVWVAGSATQRVYDNTFTGAVAGTIGSGGALPDGWAASLFSNQGLTCDVLANGTAFGLPTLKTRIHGTLLSGQASYLKMTQSYVPVVPGQKVTSSVLARVIAGTAPNVKNQINFFDNSHVYINGSETNRYDTFTGQWAVYTLTATAPALSAFFEPYLFRTIGSTNDVVDFTLEICAPTISVCPLIAGSTIHVPTDAAASADHLADIIQRAVDLRGPFAVEIVATTAPGDPGAHQTYWCESLGANDYAEIYRATSTNQITLKVRANSTDYSVACGAVANSTQFTLRLGMLFNKVLWSLNGSTVAELTIKRSAPYIMETLGALWDATLYGWCSIQSIRVSAGKIATAAEIEGGWA